MIALHGTDPASVYLAAWARSADGHRAIGHAAVERALYQDQELLRMLGMRRTMFVVPAGLAPVIQAACTDQVAERMRKGLVRDLATAGVAADAGRWLDEVGDATVRALTARGAATGAELIQDRNVHEARHPQHCAGRSPPRPSTPNPSPSLSPAPGKAPCPSLPQARDQPEATASASFSPSTKNPTAPSTP